MGSGERKAAGVTGITLLDGGIGQELVKRSPEPPTGLWGTKVMVDHPGMVEAIHRDYFRAGASVATSNTYALHHDRFAGTPLEGRLADLVDMALSEAEAARTSHGSGRIAGSIGPLGWSYAPDIHPARAEAVPRYAEIAALIAPRIDLLLCETVASVEHAHSILEAARSTDRPVWLSVTVDDEDGTRLRSGELVTDLADLSPDAWLANCSAPEAMQAALAIFAGWGKPFGAYANGFAEITKEYLDPGSSVGQLPSRRDMGPAIYADFVMGWVGAGATIVGGCCEIGPDHIREVARRLGDAGHEIV